MKLTAFFMLVCLPLLLRAQTETFDIVTYRPPAGWKKQLTEYAVSFSKVDNATGAWCQVAIYRSVAGTGIAADDFSNEWKALVVPETYAGSTEPAPVSYTADGWTRSSGISNFQWQGKDAQVSVLNISGYGIMISTLISMNDKKFAPEVDALLRSIQLKKPAPPAQPAQPSQRVTAAPAQTNTAVSVTEARGLQGISVATTNFDDGWVAQPYADYVKVSKQGINVLLHYAITIDDQMRRADNMAVLMWNRLVASRYRTASLQVYENEMYTYNKIWFVEANATEIASGKNMYVGLRVLVANGIASCIEIVSPSAAAFKQLFPDQTSVERMPGYNKFAVSANDMVGTWDESTSTGLNYYNTVTGGYVGTSTTAAANKFIIKTGGSYESQHKGAYGMTGSMQFYDQKYTGRYVLTPWEVSMTNRFKGQTDIFMCHYEAVRGGRILYLRDKTYPAVDYQLVKVQ